MRPVIERIAQRMRHGRGPGLELGKRLGVASAEALGDSVGPHRAPFVVIAFQPNLKEVSELAVFGDVARGEMIVVVEDRLRFSKVVIQSASGFGLQQKVFVDEFHDDVVVLKVLIRNSSLLKATIVRWNVSQVPAKSTRVNTNSVGGLMKRDFLQFGVSFLH